MTASVLRIHPPDVMVSAMMPRVAAEFASLSALLAPMKRAAVSSTAGVEPGEKMAESLERLGWVSMFSLNSVLSPSRRGVRREFSSWGERGGGSTPEPMPPLPLEKFFFKPIKRGLQEGPAGKMVDSVSFRVDQELAQCRVIPNKAIVRQTVKP